MQFWLSYSNEPEHLIVHNFKNQILGKLRPRASKRCMHFGNALCLATDIDLLSDSSGTADKRSLFFSFSVQINAL